MNAVSWSAWIIPFSQLYCQVVTVTTYHSVIRWFIFIQSFDQKLSCLIRNRGLKLYTFVWSKRIQKKNIKTWNIFFFCFSSIVICIGFHPTPPNLFSYFMLMLSHQKVVYSYMQLNSYWAENPCIRNRIPKSEPRKESSTYMYTNTVLHLSASTYKVSDCCGPVFDFIRCTVWNRK